jgi:hypothetical protein
MTDITHSCKWRGSSGNRPPHLEIKDKEAKVWMYNMEIPSRSFGHISLSRDQRKREELRLIRTSREQDGPSIKPCFRDLWSLYTHWARIDGYISRESADGMDLGEGLGSSTHLRGSQGSTEREYELILQVQ